MEESYHRAAPGGTGSTKCIGNYSPVLKVQLKAKEGYSDVIYLDAVNNKYIEEVSRATFSSSRKKIATPRWAVPSSRASPASPSSTWRAKGFEVEERDVSVEEVLEADECFCTGTAVVVVPVGSVTLRGEKCVFQEGGIGPVGQPLYDDLTGLQSGKVEDTMGWLEKVPEGFHL